jgi:hypothetical protein
MESCYWIWHASRVHGVICSRAAKLISFTADESASQCVGSTADAIPRHRTSSTAVGYDYISTIASKPKQRVGFWADTSAAKFGDDDTSLL